MTVEQKKDVVASLNNLRADLMSMQAGITHEDQMPNPDDIRTVVTKLETLLELIEGDEAPKS